MRKAEGLERIDVVLENAGMLTEKFSVTEDNEYVCFEYGRIAKADTLQDDIDCQCGINILTRIDDIAQAPRECSKVQYQPQDIDCFIVGTSLHHALGKILSQHLSLDE